MNKNLFFFAGLSGIIILAVFGTCTFYNVGFNKDLAIRFVFESRTLT
jgi:hypothetical protein